LRIIRSYLWPIMRSAPSSHRVWRLCRTYARECPVGRFTIRGAEPGPRRRVRCRPTRRRAAPSSNRA